MPKTFQTRIVVLAAPAALFFVAASLLAAASDVPPPLVPSVPGTILGVRPGMDPEQADALLKPLGTTPGMAGEDKDSKDKDAKDKDAKPTKPKSGEDEDEGHSELWTLRGTPYTQVVVHAGTDGRLAWLTGFLRPGQEMPFARFGDPKRALVFRDTLAVWNVLPLAKTTVPPYRLIVRGAKGQARSVSLISLAPPKR